MVVQIMVIRRKEKTNWDWWPTDARDVKGGFSLERGGSLVGRSELLGIRVDFKERAILLAIYTSGGMQTCARYTLLYISYV